MIECAICGRNGCGDPLDKHHVFGGPFRKKSDKHGAVVHLCHNRCHIFGKEAVHNNRENDLALKQTFQTKIMQEHGWTTEDFIREFGRNYV